MGNKRIIQAQAPGEGVKLKGASDSCCRLEKKEGIYILTLAGHDDHRLNPYSISQIIEALQLVNANAESTSALITTNEGKYFSNGLDLDWLKSLLRLRVKEETHDSCNESVVPLLGDGDCSETRRKLYPRLLATVMGMKVPTIAAICGHAAAGGLIFALAHDYRLMRADRGFLYMSEIDVGVPIAAEVMPIVTSKIQRRWLTQLLLKGLKYTAPMALNIGLVDAIFKNSDETLAAAFHMARDFGTGNWNKDVYLSTRLSAFPEIARSLGISPSSKL